MIAVVTGASGFVGQNLVRRLRRDGHEVRCLVRPSGGATPRGASRHAVRYDSPRSLLECPALEDASVIFHLAGATKAFREADFFAANVTPTRNLLGALVARRLRPRFVCVSTQAAAGPAVDLRRPVQEEDPPRPVEAYGRSKLEAERIAESFGDHLAVTIVRPCAIFGAHDRDFFLLYRLAERGLIVYPGVADHWLSLLHVDDVVDGLLAAATPEAIGRTYFLSSQSAVQWRELGAHIAHAMGRPARHLDVPGAAVRVAALAADVVARTVGTPLLANRSKAALARHRFWVCSGSRAQRELQFQPARSLPEALRDTYLWYRHVGWLRGSSRAVRIST